MNRAVAHARRVVYEIIARRRAGEPRDDLLGTLLAARDDDGAGMSDVQLRDEVMTLFLAGHETTALALAHCALPAQQAPRGRAAPARTRSRRCSAAGSRPPTTRARSPYTEWVAQRGDAPLPAGVDDGPRGRPSRTSFAATSIPPGAQLVCSQWIVHRDARWFPNPEGFDPDRWSPARAKDIPRFAYFPFGGGPRVCIGNHFAMMEATLLLAIVVQRFRVELVAGQRLELAPAVTLRQKGPGLSVQIISRSTTASPRTGTSMPSSASR